jgi:hypothetical protein
MRCGARDAAECLHDHVRPHLRQAKPSDNGQSLRALAPCHDDREPSLSVSIGQVRPIIWNCFARCTQEETRRALIEGGVDPRCLVRDGESERDFEQAILDLFAEDLSHAMFRVRVRALAESYPKGELPRGAALAVLTERSGVSLSQAYRRRASTGNSYGGGKP